MLSGVGSARSHADRFPFRNRTLKKREPRSTGMAFTVTRIGTRRRVAAVRRSECAASHRAPTTLACYRLRGPDTSPPGIQLAVTYIFENGRSEQYAQVARSQ